MPSRSIETREILPQSWPDIEKLFGARGACGGCWCMSWRIERGGKLWEETKGEVAREKFRGLVASGAAHGVIAYEGDEPVGWCSFGPREHFPRILRMKAYSREDTGAIWSINCFFIPREHRGKGVARALLRAAVKACRKRGAGAAEGYPVPLTKSGERLPAAFTWTGPLKLFEDEGFEVVQALSPSRPLVRLIF